MEISLNYGRTIQIKRIERIIPRRHTNLETLERQAAITRHRGCMRRNTYALANRCRYSIAIWVIDFEGRHHTLIEYFLTEKEAQERIDKLWKLL